MSICIVGSGIIGLSTALAIQDKEPRAKVGNGDNGDGGQGVGARGYKKLRTFFETAEMSSFDSNFTLQNSIIYILYYHAPTSRIQKRISESSLQICSA